MFLKNFLPATSIREYIRFYRIVHLEFESPELGYKAFPPKPEHCLYFYPFDRETIEYAGGLKKVFVPPVTLIGQQIFASNRYHEAKKLILFQIMFQPSGLYRLTGIPSNELSHEFLDAECVFSADVKLVNEQLYNARDYSNMIRIADQFIFGLLRKKIKEMHPLDIVSSNLLERNEKNYVDQLAKESFLSTKQFERKFHERIGIYPKQYEKIVRFDKAYTMRLKNFAMSWTKIAFSCGYRDYQHLVKDYKEFTGLTPIEFQVLDEKSAERTFGIAEEYYRSNRIGSLG